MVGFNDNQEKESYLEESPVSNEPIEPKSEGLTKPALFKWFLFLFFIVYFLISLYQVRILTRLGTSLIMAHPPEKSDLIVCLGGENIERGLAAVDAYREELAPVIYISRQEVPDGYDLLKEKGVDYPKEIDLLEMMLIDLGVPETAIIHGDVEVNNSWDEAQVLRKKVEEKGFKSIIIITSPTHSRRAWLTYNKVFENDDVRILSLPSEYSQFSTEGWWKERKYLKDVLLEYEKLLYYKLKYNI
ncbi:YdcF family protein [Deltaproteobacteria bacterium]|nr:YdcF family protein [Deltaproteobacteria bacterium]